MRPRIVLAIGATLIYLISISTSQADQNVSIFEAGRVTANSWTDFRQNIHIFLNSERQAVSSIEVEKSPFNAILKLRTSYIGTARISECTAFAVDRSIIVTAAHCLHLMDVATQSSSLAVIQGLSASTTNLSPAEAKQVKVSNASIYFDTWQHGESPYDCAVLKLDKPFPSEVTPFDLDESGAMCMRASHFETSGYTGPVLQGDPGGIRNLQSYDPDCHDRSAEFSSSLERVGSNKMIIDCSGDKGASGSPIYCSTNGKHYVRGIFDGENAPLHAEAVPFGDAWNFAEKISSCARQVRILRQRLYPTGH